MKKVTLKYYSETKSGYEVWLGNGAIHSFSSLKQTKSFLVETSRFLTSVLYEFRFIYIDVLKKYHDDWCYFVHDKKTMGSDRYQSDTLCSSYLTSIHSAFDRCIIQSSFRSGPYRAFADLSYISTSLTKVVSILLDYASQRSDTGSLYFYESLVDRIEHQVHLFSTYSVSEASSINRNSPVERYVRSQTLVEQVNLEIHD